MIGLLLTICSMTVICSLTLEKKINEIFFWCGCLYILLIYSIGLFGGLKFILYINGCIVFYAAFLIIKNIIKNKEKVFTLLINRVFIYILISFILSIFLTRCCIVGQWDEYTHWAVCVKNMFIYDKLRTDYFTDPVAYPPFVSIIQYVAMKMHGSYDENVLFSSLLFFSSMPMCEILCRDNNVCSILNTVIKTSILSLYLFFLPMSFFSNYINVIYVDAYMGILMGAIMFYFAIFDFSTFHFVRLVTFISALLLTKEFSIVMVLGVYFAFLLDMLFIRRTMYVNAFCNIKTSIIKIIEHVLILISPVLFILSWRLFIQQFASAHNNISGVKILFPEYTKSVMDTFFSTILTNGIALGSGLIFWPTIYYIIFFVLLIWGIYKYIYDNKKTSIYAYMLIVIIESLVYIIGLLMSYLFVFSENEALSLASFGRYILTLIVSIFISLNMVILYYDKERLFKSDIILYFIISCGLLSISYIPIYGNISAIVWGSQANDEIVKSSEYIEQYFTSVVDKEKKVLFISSSMDYLKYWQVAYYITPIHLQGSLDTFNPGVVNEETIDINDFESYDYIYLSDIDESFIQRYKSMFIDEIQQGKIYSISINNEELQFQIANEY